MKLCNIEGCEHRGKSLGAAKNGGSKRLGVCRRHLKIRRRLRLQFPQATEQELVAKITETP